MGAKACGLLVLFGSMGADPVLAPRIRYWRCGSGIGAADPVLALRCLLVKFGIGAGAGA